VWEHGNIGQYWKGTREQGPPLGDPQFYESELLRLASRRKENLCNKDVYSSFHLGKVF